MKFWYESNAFFGWVKSMEDLKEVLSHQTGENGVFNNVDDFLDRSFQHEKGGNNFGTRIEHYGKLTLREYLDSKGVNYNELY